MSVELDFLSYTGERNNDVHDHAQLVLPLTGELALDINGTADRLHVGRAAFVAPHILHSQMVTGENAFLVVNGDITEWGPAAEQLAERVFFPIPDAACHLIDFARLSRSRVSSLDMARCWLPLLLNTFGILPPPSRLSLLAGLVDAAPGSPWTVAELARRVGISPSRLHALFREEWDTTPQAWLAERRIRFVQRWLATSDRSLPELALMAGYSDQSALTKAMQRLTGTTPGAYRKEIRTKKQES